MDPADHKGQVIVGNPNAHIDGNLTPTIVMNPARDSKMVTGEIFGPILPVLTYKNIDEVVAYINSKPKPLAVYYFGTNAFSNPNLMKLK